MKITIKETGIHEVLKHFAVEKDSFGRNKLEDFSVWDWDRLNVKTCGIIYSCLCKEHKYQFIKKTSSAKLWKAQEINIWRKVIRIGFICWRKFIGLS